MISSEAAADDGEAVRRLDRLWNEAYLRNDRSAFVRLLADDFLATLPDGRTVSKADMLEPTPDGAQVSFSETGVELFAPAAVSRGRIRIEHADRVVDQRYVRVYAKRGDRWVAVSALVFPVGQG